MFEKANFAHLIFFACQSLLETLPPNKVEVPSVKFVCVKVKDKVKGSASGSGRIFFNIDKKFKDMGIFYAQIE